MSSEVPQSVFEKLWDKKLPQYIGSYLAVGFGVLQFLTFVTTRYDLQSSIVEKYLLVWLLLLPAIATLIYFKGKLQPVVGEGIAKWPKYLVISNVALALILGGVMFNGSAKAENSESETIILTDEQGKEITHVVPSLNKVQTIASFRFENLTGDDDQDWWGPAFSDLLMHDLEQRPEFYVKSEFHLYDFYDRLGLEGFKLPNVGMQREIAQKSRSDYFTRISYTNENNEFVMKGELYTSRDGKSIIQLNAVDADPFKAIEKLKLQIVENIPDALETLESQISLPASSLLTSNPKALMYYTQSQIAFTKDANNVEEMKRLGLEAINEDSSCSLCYINVGIAYYVSGQTEEARKYVKNSIKYGASLPERMQFAPKEILYGLNQNIEAYWKLQEVKKKMFPYEFSSYETLLGKYKVDYGIDSAKVLMNEAIENGNIEKGLLALYDLQLENEEFAEAEKTLDRFSGEFPDREQDKIKYADIYERQGKLEEAKNILLEAEAMDPLNTTIQTNLAYLDFKNLEIEEANKRVDQGITQSMTLTDSLDLYWTKSYLLSMTGRIKEAFDALSDYEKHSIKRVNHVSMLSTVFSRKSYMYQSTSNPNKINELLDEIKKYSPEDDTRRRCMINTMAVANDYELLLTSEEFASCHDVYQKFGDGYAEYFDVMLYYQKGEYDQCVKILDGEDERMKKLFSKEFMAKIYIKGGERNKAKEVLQKSLDQKPYAAEQYFMMAQILESEDKAKAKEYLDIALKYWANADENYIPAQRAVALSNRLR